MRSTTTPASWPSSAPVRLTYLEKRARLGVSARQGCVIAQRYELELPLVHAVGAPLWHARQRGAPFAQEFTLQLLDPAIADDPGLLESFYAEARAAAELDHPHVARVLDYGVDRDSADAVPYLVLERLTGETLAARLEHSRRLPPRELARIFRELALGLEALHERGLVHRGLDPAHVFLARHASAVDARLPVTQLLLAIDELFGDHLRLVRKLSHQFSAESASREPRGAEPWDAELWEDAPWYAGPWEGAPAPRPASPDTAEYQSPEQLLGHGPVSERSDLWSLAVIAFEALTGAPAFSGAGLGERLVQICSGVPNSAPKGLALPAGFARWFQKGVSKAPRERFGSAREMAEALMAVLEA